MIHYLRHDEIDTDKWDQCIRKSFNSLVYGYSWYLDVVCHEWDGLVEDDYVRVMPLTGKRKAGIHYLYQPLFTQQLGIFSTGLLNNQKVSEFLQQVPQKYKLAEINLNTFNKPVDASQPSWKAMLNFELDLISSYEELRLQYSKNLKRNIRKAEKAKLELMENIKPEEVIRIFRGSAVSRKSNFNEEAYRMLKQLIYVLIYRGRAKVWGAFDHRNSLLAGAVFVRSKNKWIFLFSGTSQDARENGAMPFIIDRFILNHAGSHSTLDFEGSNDQNLARFYKSFGAKQCVYYHYQKNRLPFWARYAKNAMDLLQKSFS